MLNNKHTSNLYYDKLGYFEMLALKQNTIQMEFMGEAGSRIYTWSPEIQQHSKHTKFKHP